MTPSKDVFIITAPSGAGKSTLIKRLMSRDRDLLFGVSHTTRPKRDGEIEGVDYYFVEEATFKGYIEQGFFLEWAKVGDFYYGTSQEEIEKARREHKKILFDIDVQGFLNFREKKIAATTIFIKTKSLEELERRLKNRKTDSDEQIQKRLGRAKKELEYENCFDYVIINDDLDKSVSEIEKILYS